MKQYWVSLLIQDTENSKPWHCAMSDSCSNLEQAKAVIAKGRKNFRVLAAWVDTFDENNNKTIILHECYVNALGTVDKL